MGRLIWAELKKTLLNRKLMIGILVSLIATIALFSYIFKDSIKPRYSYDRPKDYSRVVSGQEAFGEIEYNVNNYIMFLDVQYNYAAEIAKHKDYKAFIIDLYNTMPQKYNDRLEAVLNSDEITEFVRVFAQNPSTLTEDVRKFLDSDSVYNQKLNELVAIDSEIKLIIKEYDNYKDKLYYPMGFESRVEPFDVNNMFQAYYRIGISNISEAFAFMENYDSATAEQQENKITNASTKFNSFIDNIIMFESSYGKLFSQETIKSVLSKFEFAIFPNLKSDHFSVIKYSLVDSHNNASNRLNQIVKEAEKYKTIDRLNAEQKEEKELLLLRASNIYQATEKLIQKSILIDTIDGKSKNEIENYATLSTTNVYEQKKYVAKVPYILEKGLHIENINSLEVEGYISPSGAYSFQSLLLNVFNSIDSNMSSYLDFMYSILAFVLVAICVVISGGSIASEQTNGTIKMLIIRPYKRWKILTAKILSTLILSLMLILFTLIVLLLVGLVFFRFDQISLPVLAVFNAEKVFVMSSAMQVVVKLLFLFFTIIIYTIIATFMSAVFKSKTGAVTVILVLMLLGGVISSIIPNNIVIKLLIFSNIDLYNFFGLVYYTPAVSFTHALIVCLSYSVVFGFLTYYFFNKKDLN